MKWLLVASGALLTACSSATYDYSVETAEAHSPVTTATVEVCREPAWRLERSGTRFEGRSTSPCEGSGVVRLTHLDGTITECPVGYVTTMDQGLAFVVRGQSCELIEAQLGSE